MWLFGSLPRSWFHEASDVDLAVTGVAPGRIGPAWDRVVEIVGGRVDLVSLDEAPPGLRRHIVETGEKLR
ncbi:MAG: nucleotidyltransferase domain-containing protein [Deltaproteobacteria bacterium]|nr:nucleotidyltransferase domain-containing protein [Deltaproteobacteria bacterium]